METIWTFIIIITASLTPAEVNGDLLGGEVENRTTVYFATQEACNKSRQQSIENKVEISATMMNAKVTITVCEGVQIAN